MGRSSRFEVACGALLLSGILASTVLAQTGAPDGEWPAWGGDDGSTRYSALSGINASNVDRLEIAWRWKMDNFGPAPEGRSQTVPVMIDGVLYATAGMNRDVVAIDAATGQTLWMYRNDEGERAERAPRRNSGRGVAYWDDGSGSGRIVTITPGYHLVALDARTGRPVPDFGTDGVVDLMQGLRVPEGVDPVGMIGSSSPPVIANGVVVVAEQRIEHFQSNDLVELAIVHLVDDAHTAATESLEHPEALIRGHRLAELGLAGAVRSMAAEGVFLCRACREGVPRVPSFPPPRGTPSLPPPPVTDARNATSPVAPSEGTPVKLA